jgi:hypothetical protein
MNANIASVLRSSFGLLIGMFLIYLFFRTAPYLLLIGAVVFAFFKINSKIKSWKSARADRTVREEKLEEEEFDSRFDFTQKNVVDVEYYEVKE